MFDIYFGRTLSIRIDRVMEIVSRERKQATERNKMRQKRKRTEFSE